MLTFNFTDRSSGPVPANTTDMELDDVEKKFPEVQWGGRYTPPNCTAKHKVAIIVPYRYDFFIHFTRSSLLLKKADIILC